MTDRGAPPPFQPFPELEPSIRAALRADIKARGVVVPIVVDQRGRIIDGHHRKAIADELGIDCPQRVQEVADDEEALGLALTLNATRRHLTPQQRRELVGKCLAVWPNLSDREIGRRAGNVDGKTVASVRTRMERRAEIPHTGLRTDTAGRQQPASKKERNATPFLPSPLTDWSEWDEADEERSVAVADAFAEGLEQLDAIVGRIRLLAVDTPTCLGTALGGGSISGSWRGPRSGRRDSDDPWSGFGE